MSWSVLRRAAFTGVVVLCSLAPSLAADISVKTRYYNISGDTGAKLMAAMDRKGPKHGFQARAIAQTQYSLTSGADLAFERGVCRAKRARIGLAITYVYPRVASGAPASLQQRWGRFYAGVERHEEMHGRLAKEMALAAEKSVAAISVKGDRSCAKARAEVKRRVSRVVAEYERRQVRFDNAEHRDGGNVERLVSSLLGKRG